MGFDEISGRFLGMVTARHVLEHVVPSMIPQKMRDLPALDANRDQSDTRYGPDYTPWYCVHVDGENILTVFRRSDGKG